MPEDTYLDELEARLARSMTKALDTVVAELEARLRSLEEDQARILRHLGMANTTYKDSVQDREIL